MFNTNFFNMRLKTMMVAALAALTLAGCSKDGENDNTKPLEGESARLGITLRMPVQTRAFPDDVNATTAESELKSVTVYVFSAANGAALTDGGFTHFPSVTSSFTESNGTYTLNASENIKAVSGSVKVYVAANLPSLKAVAYSTESAMLAAFDELAKIDNTDGSTGFTMFSPAIPLTLAAYDENDASTIGKAPAVLDRVVSKLVASTATTTYSKSWFDDDVTNKVTFEYKVVGMGVYNEAVESYLALNSTTKSTLNTYAQSVLKNNAPVPTHPTGENATSALTGFYICENTEGAGDATFGKSTYAMIATTVTIDKEGEWDATADGGDGDVVYKSTTPYGGGTDDVWVVIYRNIHYVTSSKTKAEAITAGLEGKYSLSTGSLDDNIYLYKDGYVHFQVYLNREGRNDYNVGRNEFIHVKVGDIALGDGKFPGYPGDENNPEKPIDPTDPTDPNNPDPKDPDDNIDPDEAALTVEIDVNKWTYRVNEATLQ